MTKNKTNMIDKIYRYLSPEKSLKRQHARRVMLFNNFYGASKTRRETKNWRTSGGSADSISHREFKTLRHRSRDIVRNNPIGGGAISTNVTHVVGTGLRMQSRIDRDILNMSEEQSDKWEAVSEREWRLFAESKDCDAARTLNFAEMTSLVFRQALENGDSVVVLPRINRINQAYSLRIQIIESDRVSNPNGAVDTNEIRGGVKKNSFGAPISYFIQNNHPGDIFRAKKDIWTEVEAYGGNTGLKNVIHIFKTLRAGQTRGIPYLSPVIETLKQISNLTENELQASVVAGIFTVFIKSETGDLPAPMQPTSEVGGTSSDDDYRLGNGAIVGLAPGEDIDIADPKRPSDSFDPFFSAIVQQIGIALELPYEVLMKRFTASFSAARAALLEAWQFFRVSRKWLVDNFCQEIYEIWMYEAVAKGRLVAPGYFNDPIIRKAYQGAEWVGPVLGQIDSLKEIKAAKERVSLGISTRAHEAMQITGLDYDKIQRQLDKEGRQNIIQENNNGDYDEVN